MDKAGTERFHKIVERMKGTRVGPQQTRATLWDAITEAGYIGDGVTEVRVRNGSVALWDLAEKLRKNFGIVVPPGDAEQVIRNVTARIFSHFPRIRVRGSENSEVAASLERAMNRLATSILDRSRFYPTGADEVARNMTVFGYSAIGFSIVRRHFGAFGDYRVSLFVPKSPLVFFDPISSDPFDIFVGEIMPYEQAQWEYDARRPTDRSVIPYYSSIEYPGDVTMILRYFKRAVLDGDTVKKKGISKTYIVEGDTLRTIHGTRTSYELTYLPVVIIPFVRRTATPLYGRGIPDILRQNLQLLMIALSAASAQMISGSSTHILYDPAVIGRKELQELAAVKLIPVHEMSMRPGKVVEIERGGQIAWDVMQFVQMLEQKNMMYSGVNPAALGVSRAGDPASKVRMLYEIANEQLGGTLNNVASAMSTLFTRIISSVYYDAVLSGYEYVSFASHGVPRMSPSSLRDIAMEISVDIGGGNKPDRNMIGMTMLENGLKILQTQGGNPIAERMVEIGMRELGMDETPIGEPVEVAKIKRENQELINGAVVPIGEFDNHMLHVQYHLMLVNSPDFNDLPKRARDAIISHVRLHMTAIEAAQKAQQAEESRRALEVAQVASAMKQQEQPEGE